MIIIDSSDTPESSARQAEKEFGNMLPLGMKFRVGITPGGRKRLQIKNGRKVMFEFNTFIGQKDYLTRDKVKYALEYIKKYG